VYKLILSNKAVGFLDRIAKSDKKLFNQFIHALEEIKHDPFIGKSLTGNLKGYWSYRIRNYRILYEIEKKRLIVFIEKIAHRKNSYQ
jgi:mRNA interferase RelE/StbE